MGKGLMRLITVGAALAVAAVSANGSVGSIISSFKFYAYYPPEATEAIHRDASHVYILMWDYGGNKFIKGYLPNGTQSGGGFLGGWPPGGDPLPYDIDNTVLGAGYVGVVDNNGFLWIHTTSGSLVSSGKPIRSLRAFAYLPGGRYYYAPLYSPPGTVRRYTTTWSLLGSFSASAGDYIAATDQFDGRVGEFIIAGLYNAVSVYTPRGSLVSTFAVSTKAQNYSCGPGYPAYWGTTLWYYYKHTPEYGYVYQVDLGASTTVTPTSLGKVKALFR
ncbi:MAG: hypothetical protein V3T41_03000 [bacterium]